MHCWNGNPYVSGHVDNVVPGEPAGEPHQPKAIDDGIGQEHLYSGAVAGERAEEPHQQGTRSETMDRRRQQPAGRGDERSDSKRVGKALVSILRHTHKDQWLTLDELLQRLRRRYSRSDVAAVLATDTRRFMSQSREADASGWVEYEYSARPKRPKMPR